MEGKERKIIIKVEDRKKLIIARKPKKGRVKRKVGIM